MSAYVLLLAGVLESLEDIVMDCCGSHVLETLIKTEGCVTNGDGQGSKQDSEDESVVLQVAQFCSRNIWQCVSDVYCSHVVRTLIQSLGGVEVGGKGRQTKGARGGRVRTVCNVSDRYVKALHGLARSVRKCEQLKEMLTDVNASPVLQVLLFVLHQREPSSAVKLVSCLAKSSGLLEHSQESPDLPSLFCSTIGSHTAEVLIEVASEDLLQQVYTNSFRHRLLSLALHSKANFVLQQFLASASTEQVSLNRLIPCPLQGKHIYFNHCTCTTQFVYLFRHLVWWSAHVHHCVLLSRNNKITWGGSSMHWLKPATTGLLPV